MLTDNRDGAITLDFGDGRHRFRVAGLGELEELQEKTGVGPYTVLQRLMSSEWRVAEVRETIRIGLIGGGAKPLDALKLVERYVDARPDWLRNASLAQVIMAAALAGSQEDEVGKSDAPGDSTEAMSYQTAASPSAPSMEPPAPAESR